MRQALMAALTSNTGQLPIQFIPQGLLLEGKPLPTAVKSSVRIGRITLMVERAQERSLSPQSWQMAKQWDHTAASWRSAYTRMPSAADSLH